MTLLARFRKFFKKDTETEIEMKVEKLIVDPGLGRLLVMFSYDKGERSSVFPMNLEENNPAMIARIQIVKDMFLPLSQKFNLQAKNILLTRKEGGTEAEVRWISEKKSQKNIKLSVWEALTLAIAAEIPVFMSRELLNARFSSFPLSPHEMDRNSPYYMRNSDHADYDREVIM